jgi:hypothetical protein
VVLADSHARQSWIAPALKKRLREEFAKPRVETNEEKSRDEALGCQFREAF